MKESIINRDINDIYNFLRKPVDNSNTELPIRGKDRTVHINDFPSASNNVFHIKENNYRLSNIVLPEEIDQEIRNIVFEQKDSQFFKKIWLSVTNKIMLYGYPGCGKTILTYAIASMLGRELKVVNLSRLVSPHLGETSNNIANIFSRYGTSEYVLFIDEFDIIWRLRWDTNNDHNEMKRIVNTLLQLIDFLPPEAFLVFATNDITIIDKALLRRLDRVIEIPLPDINAIKKFLKLHLSHYSEFIKSVDYTKIAKRFLGSSFSDIEREIDKIIKNLVISFRKDGKMISLNTVDFLSSKE